MLDDFMIRALLAGIAVAFVAGPIGSFIMWRRMTFFGDAIAHSALIGIMMGYFLGLNHIFAIVIFSLIFSGAIILLERTKIYPPDALLGIISHSFLAVGLVLLSIYSQVGFNITSFLFGDILTTSYDDLKIIYFGVAIICLVLCKIWKSLLLATINEDLAKVEGINVNLINIKFMAIISIFVAISIKIVGALLVTSLMIIPAATARSLASTPERMVVFASVIGCITILIGLVISYIADTPTGPTIISLSAIIFITNLLAGKFVKTG